MYKNLFPLQTTAYSRYTAAIETDDDIIKKAFSISPSRGMGEENFFIIISDTNAIDFENGEWGHPKTFKVGIFIKHCQGQWFLG